MSASNPKELVLLVGGNPLPNYVAACALRNKLGIERVHLFYTDQVKDVKDNLLQCLRESGFQCREPSFIEDAGSADIIKRACSDISPGSHLHYTGGTNSMAVHIYAAWKQKGGTEARASYLYGRDDRLLTDTGTAIDIEDVLLDLNTLATLHGLEDCKPREPRSDDPRLPEDANEIAAKVLDNPTLANELYKASRTEKDFRKKPLQFSEYGLSLSVLIAPDKGWSDERIEIWRKFLRGDWLEEWVALQVQASGVKLSSLHVGVSSKIKGREFELDVVAIRGHHLHVISCTTDRSRSICKSKLFEVAMRARQLGGDLARSALVCLADRDEEEKDIVDDLQKDVRTLSEAQREPLVFGLRHLREWTDWGGGRPDLTSLVNWLRS